MAEKSTAAEVEQRMGEIYDLLLTRANHRTICRYASAKWGCTIRQTERYIQKARERLIDLAFVDQQEELGKAKGLYDAIITRQMNAGDLRGARASLDKLVELLGVASPKRVEFYDFSSYSDQQLIEVIAREYPQLLEQAHGLAGRALPPLTGEEDGSGLLDTPCPDAKAGALPQLPGT